MYFGNYNLKYQECPHNSYTHIYREKLFMLKVLKVKLYSVPYII